MTTETTIVVESAQTAPGGFGWILLMLVGGMIMLVALANIGIRRSVGERYGELGEPKNPWGIPGVIIPAERTMRPFVVFGAVLLSLGVVGFLVAAIV